MVNTYSGLRRETPLKDSHSHPTAMTNTDALHQLQNRIAEMEQRHDEELTKLKAGHD